VIEVGLVLLHDLAEMAVVEDEEEVEAFAPHTAQESLAYGVGLGRLIGRGQDVDMGSLATRSNAAPYLLSLSRIKKRGPCPYGVASRSC